jgi:hypothetical protein
MPAVYVVTVRDYYVDAFARAVCCAVRRSLLILGVVTVNPSGIIETTVGLANNKDVRPPRAEQRALHHVQSATAAEVLISGLRTGWPSKAQ